MSTPPDIFISYAREDQATARRFAEGFERAGFSVWWDQALNAGEAFDQVTEKALEDARAVVVLWSKHSVESRWVRAEAAHADERTALVPALIEPCSIPVKFRLTQTADLSGWSGNQDEPRWQQFVEGLRKFTGASATTAPAPSAAMPQASTRRPRWLLPVIAAAAAVLLVAGTLLWNSHRQPASTVAAQGQQSTLAVLPFVNLSNDPDQEYFSDGLTEELLNQLAQVKDLRLTARTSSFAFKGKNEDMRFIGEKLGVAHLLEGSVRKSGDDLRITAQLIDARDGTHLWSETYDRKLNDIFAVQDEIAKTVAGKLTVALDVGEMSRARGGTTSIEAYDKYLQGRAVDWRRGTREDYIQAAQLYREAVRIDPDFVRAWAALFDELYISRLFVPEQGTLLRAEMQQVYAQLEMLERGRWFARGVRVANAIDQHQWSAANAEILAAWNSTTSARYSAADPVSFGFFLYNTGRISEALPGSLGRRDADPLSLNASYGAQVPLGIAGRFEEAQAEYERSKSLDGDHSQINTLLTARLMGQRADPAEIEASIRELPPGDTKGENFRSQLLLVLRDPKAGAELVRRALTDRDDRNASRTSALASLADYFDDRDLALQALRIYAVDQQGPNLSVLWQPWNTGLRATPEFKAILKDVGLADYFRQSGNWGEFCKPISDTDFECH